MSKFICDSSNIYDPNSILTYDESSMYFTPVTQATISIKQTDFVFDIDGKSISLVSLLERIKALEDAVLIYKLEQPPRAMEDYISGPRDNTKGTKITSLKEIDFSEITKDICGR